MLRFRVNLYARPDSLEAGEPITLRNVKLATLRGRGQQTIFDAYLPVTFEAALAEMQKLPRMDAEPDGYYVFSGGQQGERWQIDGHLFDFSGRLHRVEMSGHCPAGVFAQLLAIFAPEASEEKKSELAFELIREGVVMDKDNFLRWANAD
ncbi:hypothetical protein [Adhaeretor mobilis]|uniref:Uncharacterized protein n=1 Tax=Adhaeretor mobilis TaxID=1930276 RepID=A0A517MR20_9BACT|nr:hypothetical protein [Adhaeretor mobilis]QDS97338.1 hypothetical protein HG15A2_05990 [Adhaeretor mobilis]